jgi:Flp pilus assembly protein TadG
MRVQGPGVHVRGVPQRPSRVVRSRAGSSRGQSLVELALVVPILLVLFGGAVQLGIFFAAQNSLIQVARDTARWAATQQTYNPCSQAATGSPPPLLAKADELASTSSLVGYSSGTWNAGNFTNPASLPPNPPNGEGVEVAWSGTTCPPADNVSPAYVKVRVTHTVPVIVPGLQYLPVFGTCDASGCHLSLSSTSIFRMEPPRQ